MTGRMVFDRITYWMNIFFKFNIAVTLMKNRLKDMAYALAPLTREERAAKAKVIISTHFNSKQQVFLSFVLSHYVRVGVGELDQGKLTPLLRLKYHGSIADAVADLGKPE